MTSDFNSYQIWLSTPPSEQPADYYRLLGLPLFESDPDVIRSAARRMERRRVAMPIGGAVLAPLLTIAIPALVFAV